MRHVRFALSFMTCLFIPACGGQPAAPGSPAPAATKVEEKGEAKVEAKAPEATPTPTQRRGRQDGPKGKAVQLEKAPEAVRRAFWEAIQAGRKATAKKDYAAAVASFDAALAQIPDHPRALSGRGYARLLAGQLDEAEADLRKALAAPGTKKLESAIAFNLGLVAEKRGEAEVARAQFSLANALNPSKAAQDKLAGAAACPVVVEYATRESVLHATWMDAWKALVELGVFDGEKRPADEATAEAMLCAAEPLADPSGAAQDICKQAPGGPWISRRYFDYGGHALIAVEPADAGQIRVTDLGWAGGGRCGADSEASVARDTVTLVTWLVSDYAPIEVMENEQGEIVDCEGDAICFSACGEEIDASFTVYAFSPWTPEPTVVHGPLDAVGKPVATVTVEGRELVIKGGGCDLRAPLVNPKG